MQLVKRITTTQFEQVKQFMSSTKELYIDENYDRFEFLGNGKTLVIQFYIVHGWHEMAKLRKYVFNQLPKSNLETFSYYSNYGSEIEFDCFKGFSQKLKNLFLQHMRGLNFQKYRKVLKHINFSTGDFYTWLKGNSVDFENVRHEEFNWHDTKLRNVHKQLLGSKWEVKFPPNSTITLDDVGKELIEKDKFHAMTPEEQKEHLEIEEFFKQNPWGNLALFKCNAIKEDGKRCSRNKDQSRLNDQFCKEHGALTDEGNAPETIDQLNYCDCEHCDDEICYANS